MRVLLVVFTSLILSSKVYANPPILANNTHQKNYIMSLGKVYTGIKAVEFDKDSCNRIHPEYARTNNLAYNNWKNNHNIFLVEFEKRYAAYLKNLAGNNSLKHKQYIKIMNGKFEQQNTIRYAELKKMSGAHSKIICKKYPESIESTLNPELLYKKEISIVRQNALK